jgi:predicted phage terminase large subunit-like protein
MKPSTRARFKSWLKLVSPSMTWDWAHQEYLYSYLNKVSDGTCKRLMIFMPPRHGKSETVTVRYTAWRLAHDPSMNVILGSYNQRLANRFSRKIRRVLTDDAALAPELEPSRSVPPAVAGGALQPPTDESRHETNHGLCPQCHRQKASGKTDESKSSRPCTHAANRLNFTHRPANSEAEWETGQGGGLRAVGVGSGVTGFGASLIVVDDPVKSRAEAESETYRNKVWDWFNDDLYTRLEPNGSIILIQTRWHEDDLAGRLIKEMNDGGEHWDIVNLPALCEAPDAGQNRPRERAGSSAPQLESRLKAGLKTPPERSQEGGFTPALTPTEYDPIGRLPGDALCPERYDEAALEKMRRKLGSYSFSALYQQRPVPAEGGLFKMSWFKNMVAAPPPGLKWNRGYDLAVSIKTTACYTASARCAFDREGNLYISDVFRQRLEFPDQRKYIVGRINQERDTEHGVELALHGHAIIQDLRRDPQLRGRPFRGVKVDADKITRALGWANLAEEGKVILVRGPWIQEFLNEVREFPSGKFDDQIDAVSLAVNMCKRRVRSFHSF